PLFGGGDTLDHLGRSPSTVVIVIAVRRSRAIAARNFLASALRRAAVFRMIAAFSAALMGRASTWAISVAVIIWIDGTAIRSVVSTEITTDRNRLHRARQSTARTPRRTRGTQRGIRPRPRCHRRTRRSMSRRPVRARGGWWGARIRTL